MKYTISLFILFLSLVCNSQDLRKSVVRNDNDYVTYIDNRASLETTPTIVKDKFNNILHLEHKTNNEAILYKISISDTLALFTLVIKNDINQRAYLCCYNFSRKTISKNPIILNLKWAFNGEEGFTTKLLTYPLAKVENDKIYLKERVHNGNAYNAVITKVYSLNSDLSFSLIFCFESSASLPEEKMIKRIIDNNTILAYEVTDTSCLYLGKTIIDFNSKKIITKESSNESIKKLLFTISGKEDEEIFKKGYSFSY